jgi:hypothetical protein
MDAGSASGLDLLTTGDTGVHRGRLSSTVNTEKSKAARPALTPKREVGLSATAPSALAGFNGGIISYYDIIKRDYRSTIESSA